MVPASESVYSITPAGGRPLAFLLTVLAILVVVVGGIAVLLVGSIRAANGARFGLSEDGLRLSGDVYGRFIPAASLRGGAARLVDLGRETDLQPRRKTIGTAVPGYSSGWFRLRNGEKALLYLTARDRVVHVPTTAGYSLLLSVEEAERFLAELREVAPRD